MSMTRVVRAALSAGARAGRLCPSAARRRSSGSAAAARGRGRAARIDSMPASVSRITGASPKVAKTSRPRSPTISTRSPSRRSAQKFHSPVPSTPEPKAKAIATVSSAVIVHASGAKPCRAPSTMGPSRKSRMSSVWQPISTKMPPPEMSGFTRPRQVCRIAVARLEIAMVQQHVYQSTRSCRSRPPPAAPRYAGSAAACRPGNTRRTRARRPPCPPRRWPGTPRGRLPSASRRTRACRRRSPSRASLAVARRRRGDVHGVDTGIGDERRRVVVPARHAVALRVVTAPSRTSRRITATSEESGTREKAGPLFTSVTAPQPTMPQRTVVIAVQHIAGLLYAGRAARSRRTSSAQPRRSNRPAVATAGATTRR